MIINEENQHDVISAYLYNDLEEDELKAVETKMAEDADFEKEVEMYAALIGTYHKQQKNQFAEWMEEMGLEKEEEEIGGSKVVSIQPTPTESRSKTPTFFNQTSFLSRINRWYAVAAAVLLFLTAIFLVQLYTPTTLSTEQLVANHLEIPHEAPSNSMGLSDADEIAWNQAKDAYRNQKYVQVIELLEPLAIAGSDKAAIYFYLGLAYLYDENTPSVKAVPPLQEAVKRYSDYEDMVNWYVALAYLKGEEKVKAEAILEGIKKRNKNTTFKYEEAVELLESLNKNAR